MTEADLQLYETRGDLLETKAIAEKKARPFYLQPQLDEVNEQIHAVEQAYQIEQPSVTEAVQAEIANDDNWLGSPSDVLIVNSFKRIVNPCARVGDYPNEDGCGNDSDLYDFARGG